MFDEKYQYYEFQRKCIHPIEYRHNIKKECYSDSGGGQGSMESYMQNVLVCKLCDIEIQNLEPFWNNISVNDFDKDTRLQIIKILDK